MQTGKNQKATTLADAGRVSRTQGQQQQLQQPGASTNAPVVAADANSISHAVIVTDTATLRRASQHCPVCPAATPATQAATEPETNTALNAQLASANLPSLHASCFHHQAPHAYCNLSGYKLYKLPGHLLLTLPY